MMNSTKQTETHRTLQQSHFIMRTRLQCFRKRTNINIGGSSCHLLLCEMFFLVINLSMYVQAQSNDCLNTNAETHIQCLQGQSFFNETLQCCQTCSDCPSGTDVQRPCNSTHDTYCVPRCSHRCLYWDENEGKCVLDCSCCPSGDCDRESGNSRCECSSCFLSSDFYCDRPVLCGTEEPVIATVKTESRSNSQNTLPPWGIGLVAIGVVIGIVAFSACFLLMGFVTTTRRGDIEIQGSENSESGLVPGGQIRGHSSLGTNSTYMSASNAGVFLSNQKILELLRNSNTHSSLSSARSSPRSARSWNTSPKPVRTVHVTMKGKNTITSV